MVSFLNRLSQNKSRIVPQFRSIFIILVSIDLWEYKSKPVTLWLFLCLSKLWWTKRKNTFLSSRFKHSDSYDSMYRDATDSIQQLLDDNCTKGLSEDSTKRTLHLATWNKYCLDKMHLNYCFSAIRTSYFRNIRKKISPQQFDIPPGIPLNRSTIHFKLCPFLFLQIFWT